MLKYSNIKIKYNMWNRNMNKTIKHLRILSEKLYSLIFFFKFWFYTLHLLFIVHLWTNRLYHSWSHVEVRSTEFTSKGWDWSVSFNLTNDQSHLKIIMYIYTCRFIREIFHIKLNTVGFIYLYWIWT